MPRADHRRYGNGDPLRRVRDVSFLNWDDPSLSEYLYEAQISCMVAGSDESRWVAYGFVDTYFDPDEARKTVHSYYQNNISGQGVPDPFTNGKTLADGKIQNPREYFLEVWRHRMTQVKNEWTLVVDKLKDSIGKYDEVCPSSHFFLLLN